MQNVDNGMYGYYMYLVDGGWSRWQPTSCSVTCGGGVKSFARTCTHPSPASGGHKCQGPSTKSEVCNTQPCPGNNL